MVGLAVFLPRLPTDLERRWRRLDASTTIVLHRRERQADVVASACEHAEHRGVRPGMSLAHARMLVPKQSCIEAIDDRRVAWALRRLAVATTRWMPVVATDGLDGLLCDVSGCERLYRGIRPLIEQYAARTRHWGLAVRVAGAPTFGAAWALSRFGPDDTSLIESNPLAALHDLPLEALRLEPEALDRLARVGIERIGELATLPRAAVADRYGPHVLLRLDQAFGRTPELLNPIRPTPRVRVEHAFDGPSDRPEDIGLAVRDALRDVCDQLHAREGGCRLLELRLDRSDMPPLVLTVRTAAPTRDARHLWSLLSPKLEQAHLGFGVIGIAIHAKATDRITHQQTEHWTSRRTTETAHIGRLIDTLAARLGPASVRSLHARESHQPETAFVLDPVQGLSNVEAAQPSVTDADRPSVLFDPPQTIDVTLLIPDGPIAIVRHGGAASRVQCGIGPERIEPEWWQIAGPRATRDYFKVALEDGRVLWIFRANHQGAEAWYLHGQWA